MSHEPEFDESNESTHSGESLLERLLPLASAMVPKIKMPELRGLGPLASIISESNLASVELEPLHGGFTPVLTLKDVPESFPSRLEARSSLESLHEAEDVAVHLIAAVLRSSASPFIILDEHRLPLSRDILNVLAGKRSELLVHYPNLDDLKERIRHLAQDAFPNGFGPKAFEQIAPDVRNPLMMLIHIGAFMGIASISLD